MDIESHWSAIFEGRKVVAAVDNYGDYCGDGAGIAEDEHGYWTATYSHCSCYGPEDTSSPPDGPHDTLEDALRKIGGDDAQELRKQIAAQAAQD